MRKPTAGLTLLLACLMIFALAPAAAAQLLPIDPIGGIGDPLGGDSSGGGDSGGGGDPGGGGLGGVVDDIGETLKGDEGSSEPDGKAGNDPKLIDKITNEVDETINSPSDKIGETTEDPAGSVGGTIGGIGHAANNDLNDVSKGLTGKDGKDRKDRKTTQGITTGSGRRAAAEAYHDDVFAKSLAARQADAKNRTPITLTSSSTSIDREPAGVIAQIGRVAAEAAQQAAFPLLLTLLVGAFLIGQNRIDSRDPKLALAPLDSEQDLLSFT